MKPAHEGPETYHFVRRQAHDGLEVHDQLTSVKRMTKFLHLCQLTDGLEVPFGIKDYMVALAGALGPIERHVSVLDDFTAVGALLISDHDPDTDVPFKLRPDDRKWFAQCVEMAPGHALSLPGAVKPSVK
jgi:hypothetical protein